MLCMHKTQSSVLSPVTSVKRNQQLPSSATTIEGEETTTNAAQTAGPPALGVVENLTSTASLEEKGQFENTNQIREINMPEIPQQQHQPPQHENCDQNNQSKVVRWDEATNTANATPAASTMTQSIPSNDDNNDGKIQRHPEPVRRIQQAIIDPSVIRAHQQEQLQRRLKLDSIIQNLYQTSLGGKLVMINLAKRGLEWNDAHGIREAMLRNPGLSVLKLSYNNLADRGTALVASGFIANGAQTSSSSSVGLNNSKHTSLSILDLGFNSIRDAGCATLALHAVVGNFVLSTLYLSGNFIHQKGAMAIAGAILHGCSLSTLYLDANSIGPVGVQALARAIAEREAMVQSKVEQQQQQQHVYAQQPQNTTMEKLYLADIEMKNEGIVTISSMLLTNFSIRTLCLCNNAIDDNGIALLAQSLSRNERVPLEVLQLSFNEITCVGVECFMNAVWGSEILKEVRFDNNKIRDRGAQLAAVILTSIKLQVIDLGCNSITTVGIKALMKSLSENSSMQYLGLAGIQIDLNASKALSYGLAYSPTLRYLHVDHCSIGYSAQRHIVAGIVSNRHASLRVLTGFPIGAISATLGLPKSLEGWTNDKCLSFVRLMWKQWREENGLANMTPSAQAQAAKEMGPAPPKDVGRAARMAMALIGRDGSDFLNTEDHQKELSETSPLVHTNDTMLERTPSGNLRVPPLAQEDAKKHIEGYQSQRLPASLNVSPARCIGPLAGPSVDPDQKNRNLQWLRLHFQSLHQVGQLPFNEADLWQLHQYFFSPLVPTDDAEESGTMATESTKESSGSSPLQHEGDENQGIHFPPGGTFQEPGVPETATVATMGRSISFKTLGDVATASKALCVASTSTHSNSGGRRRSLGTMEHPDDSSTDSSTDGGHDLSQPASKRAKNFKPRVAYYPRIRQLVENLGTKPSQHQILSLLRQLKFVESIMFDGRDVYSDTDSVREPNLPTPADVEMIILDLL